MDKVKEGVTSTSEHRPTRHRAISSVSKNLKV